MIPSSRVIEENVISFMLRNIIQEGICCFGVIRIAGSFEELAT
jgi:hypothetical protein